MEKKIVGVIVEKNYGINGFHIKVKENVKNRVMAKKRKLNSKNPIYQKVDDDTPKILKKILMCHAKIRSAGGVDTGRTAAVHGIWYEN
jgi:translation initiation factor IF-2